MARRSDSKTIEHEWEIDTNVRPNVSFLETLESIKNCHDFPGAILLDDQVFRDIQETFLAKHRVTALAKVAEAIRDYLLYSHGVEFVDRKPAEVRDDLAKALAGLHHLVALPNDCLDLVGQHLRWGSHRLCGIDHVSTRELFQSIYESVNDALHDYDDLKAGAKKRAWDDHLISNLVQICIAYRDPAKMPEVSASNARSSFVNFLSKIYKSFDEDIPKETLKSRAKKLIPKGVKNQTDFA